MAAKSSVSATVWCQAMRNVFDRDLEIGMPDSVVDTYLIFARYGLEGALPAISSVDGKMNAENNYPVRHSRPLRTCFAANLRICFERNICEF